MSREEKLKQAYEILKDESDIVLLDVAALRKTADFEQVCALEVAIARVLPERNYPEPQPVATGVTA